LLDSIAVIIDVPIPLLAALLGICRLEVNEHGKSGLDQSALTELERRRQEVASSAGTTREADTTKISERPDVIKSVKTNVIEQVVPVIERDVYEPHRGELLIQLLAHVLICNATA
jgi:hypothetical protein